MTDREQFEAWYATTNARFWNTSDAAWWALVMGAAAALEDAANCLRDPDAKKAAEGAAKHYRTEANTLWPNAE